MSVRFGQGIQHAEREQYDLALRLAGAFENHRVPATWAFHAAAAAARFGREQSDVGHELAACCHKAPGRLQELLATLRQFRKAGLTVSTLVCDSAPAAADLETLVRHRINLVAVPATMPQDVTPIATLRFGLWQLGTSAVIPAGDGWLRGMWASAGVRRRVDVAIRRQQLLHVMVDAEAVAQNSHAARTLERLLRHADRRRQQGLLHVVTLGEIARQLVRPRAAATAESILRVQAA
jgi:hypothetical protein